MINVVKKQYDIVVIDNNGSEWLKYCIPKECAYSIINTYNAIPFVKSFSFFRNLFINVVKHGVKSESLLFAIILEIKPKVIITFIDNNRIMGELQSFFPYILVVSIQNGVRGVGFQEYQEYEDKISIYPHYFGFGNHEFYEMKRKGKVVKKYYPQGSFKMGVFLTSLYRPIEKVGDTKNICFISQWSPVDMSEIFGQYLFAYQEICKLLARFSQDSDIEIIIATRKGLDDKDYQKERDFFDNLFTHCNVSYSANDRLNMTSYQVAIDSDLTIGFDSTLMFELLGVEKKILCCGNADKNFSRIYHNENQCSSLPVEILLNKVDYNEFKNKVYALLEMNDSEYVNKIKNARKYYMNYGDKYPHQVIHNMIQEKCK